MIGKFNNGIFEVFDWKKLVEDPSGLISVHDRDVIKNGYVISRIVAHHTDTSWPTLTYKKAPKTRKNSKKEMKVRMPGFSPHCPGTQPIECTGEAL